MNIEALVCCQLPTLDKKSDVMLLGNASGKIWCANMTKIPLKPDNFQTPHVAL